MLHLVTQVWHNFQCFRKRGAGTASFTSDGNFTLEFTHTISSGDHYYWIEIGGSGSFGNGTVNDVTMIVL